MDEGEREMSKNQETIRIFSVTQDTEELHKGERCDL